MNIPVTYTAVLPPRRRANLLTRKRLMDLLLDLMEHPLILVVAPPGYGKTSLLIDFAHNGDIPACWYTLDRHDHVLGQFLTCFVAAIQHRYPDFGSVSSALIEHADQIEHDLDQIVTVLANEVYETISEHFVLVLDDFHFVDSNPVITAFISRFVQKAPDICHLVIVSRKQPALPELDLMIARSQVGSICLDDLAFRADEIQELALRNERLSIPEGQAVELARETEGWITGLLLSAQGNWRGITDRLRTARASGVGLYDYLAYQLLDQQPASIREFLLRTSLLDEFNPEILQSVLVPTVYPEGVDWEGLIDTTRRENLFLLPVENGVTWYRYHALFREFLQAQLMHERPDEREPILRRLAAVYQDGGEWEKTYDIYQDLKDQTVTIELIEQVGSRMIKNGRFHTLTGWLDQLPEELVQSRPALLSLKGAVAVMSGEIKRAIPLLDQAEAIFRAVGDLAGLTNTLSRRSTANHFLGHYHASFADADEILSLVGEDDHYLPVRADALHSKGLNLLWLGETEEAVRCIEASLSIYKRLEDKQNGASVLQDLGLAYRTVGDFVTARDCYHQALSYWRAESNIHRTAQILNNLGMLYYYEGDYEQASLSFNEGLSYARRSGYARMESFILAGIGDLYAQLEAPSAAQQAYCKAREVAGRLKHRALLLHLDLAEAALARSRGDLLLARSQFASALDRSQVGSSEYERGLCCLEAGRLALAEMNYADSAASFSEALQLFSLGKRPLDEVQARLYLACACYAAGEKDAARENFDKAFQGCSRIRNMQTVVIAGRELRELLEKAEKDTIVGNYVSQMLEQVRRFEAILPMMRRRVRAQKLAIPFEPPAIVIRAFGDSSVSVEGKPLANADWQVMGARDLFFYLISNLDGATKGTIGLIFWPDKSPEQLKSLFKSTIHRLRQALKQEAVIYRNDRYFFNQSADYEYDVEIFLTLLAQAKQTVDASRRADLYREAVALYKGHYLSDVDGSWVMPERERLWQRYVETILSLANHHLDRREYSLCLDYCWRALQKDPALEEAHRLIMRAHAAMGNRARVVKQHDECLQVLKNTYNTRPSPATERLFQNLTQ